MTRIPAATNERDVSAKKRPRKTNMVARLAAELRARILRKDYEKDSKLPSEAELTAKYGVSRTVVREAIAALRFDGLVEARQGAGVFVVSNDVFSKVYFQAYDTEKISSIIEVLELRTAVEVEAAGLAAMRRSPAQEGVIMERCRDISELIRNSEATADEDFAFHQAIASATNNPRFPEFLNLMGRGIIPRSRLKDGEGRGVPLPYLEQIQAEHEEISQAISEQDESAAREAMRRHLWGSSNRFRSLLL